MHFHSDSYRYCVIRPAKHGFFSLFLVILIWLCTSINLSAQVISWQKTLGGSNSELAKGSITTSDGGYIVVGLTRSNDGDVSGFHGGNEDDIWVTKLNSVGQLVWQKALGGSSYEGLPVITATTDGGYVVAATTNSNDGDVTGNHNGNGIWIVKLDGNGNLLWQKSHGSSGGETADAITATADGGVVVVGQTASKDGYFISDCTGTLVAILFKLDNQGNLVWQKSLGCAPKFYAIQETPDRSLIVAGSIKRGDLSAPTGTYDIWVVKLTDQGNPIWQKAYGGDKSEYASSIRVTADGGYVLVGSTEANDPHIPDSHFDQSNIVVIRLSTSGDLIWQKILGGSSVDYGRDIIVTPDKGYLVIGDTQSGQLYLSTGGDVSDNHGGDDIWVAKLTESGNLIWQKTFGGSTNDEPVGIMASPDGDYGLAGTTYSNDGDVSRNHGFSDFWVVKFQVSTLQLTQPLYNCGSGQLTFQSSGGTGSAIEFQAAGVTPWTTNLSQTIELGVRLDPNSEPLLLMARQNGHIITRSFEFKSLCSGANRAPVFSGPLPLQHAVTGKPFNYIIPKGTFTDPEEQDITLAAKGLPPGINVSIKTSTSGPQWLLGVPQKSGLYTVTIIATDPQGASISGSILIDVSPAPLSLTPPLYNCKTGEITFQSTDGDGSPIEFQAYGVTPWTTNPNQLVELGVRLDPNSKPLALMARQSGYLVYYTFDFRAYCNRLGAARLASESTNGLQVQVLGNPVVGSTLNLEVSGAEGQVVGLQVSDLQGQVIAEKQIDRASSLERQSLPIHSGLGHILFLRIYTPTQHQTIKILPNP